MFRSSYISTHLIFNNETLDEESMERYVSLGNELVLRNNRYDITEFLAEVEEVNQHGRGKFEQPSMSNLDQIPTNFGGNRGKHPQLPQPSTSAVRHFATSATSGWNENTYREPFLHPVSSTVDNFRYITVKGTSEKLVKKFNVMGRIIDFQFKEVPDTDTPLTWIDVYQ